MGAGFKPTNFDPIYTGQVWGGLTIGSPAGGDLSGTYPEATVSGIQGIAIDGTPTDGQVLTYASASNAWIPEPPATSNPMTTEGDMIYQHSGAEDRLAVGGAHEVLHGGTDPNYAAVTEGDLSLSDVTTGDVSTSAHGLAPKSDGTASHYLDGTGAYSTPTGTGGISDMGAFTYLDPTDQASDPAAPASGKHRLYSKSDGLYIEDSTGAVAGPLGASPGRQLPLNEYYSADQAPGTINLTVPAAASSSVLVVGYVGNGTLNSISQTNVTWTLAKSAVAGGAYAYIYVGVPSGTPGTTLTINSSGYWSCHWAEFGGGLAGTVGTTDATSGSSNRAAFVGMQPTSGQLCVFAIAQGGTGGVAITIYGVGPMLGNHPSYGLGSTGFCSSDGGYVAATGWSNQPWAACCASIS